MGLNDNKVETIVDVVRSNMQYGRRVHDDGIVVPFCQIIEQVPPQKRMEWNNLEQIWMEIGINQVLAPSTRFDKFVECDIAPHGYKAVYRKVMIPVEKA